MADVLAKITKLLFALTWARLGLFVGLLAITGLAIAFWENRPVIYTAISIGKFTDAVIPPELTPVTQGSLKSVVDRNTQIIAVEVIQANFRNNTRKEVFFYSDQDALLRSYQAYLAGKVSDLPLFITGDGSSNDRIINIMEQELVCGDVPVDVTRRIAQASAAKGICSLSVPPRYGRMVGYINIWLRDPLERGAIPEYKGLVRAMSDEIYDRDVSRTLR